MRTFESSSAASLSVRACLAWCAVVSSIGLGASGVNGWFFYLGLLVLEGGDAARSALMAAGALLIGGQVLAFALASWLPAKQMRQRRGLLLVLGIALFGFEVVTTAVTQLALSQSTDMAAKGSISRQEDLRRTIISMEQTIAGLQTNAAAQSRSLIAGSRAAGAEALRDASRVQERLEAHRAELTALAKENRPTMQSLLGSDLTAILIVGRSALLALLGLVMTSTAGFLLRLARNARAIAHHGERIHQGLLYARRERVVPLAPACSLHVGSFTTASLLVLPAAAHARLQDSAVSHEPVQMPQPIEDGCASQPGTKSDIPLGAREQRRIPSCHLRVVGGTQTQARHAAGSLSPEPIGLDDSGVASTHSIVAFKSARITVREAGRPQRTSVLVGIGVEPGAAPTVLGVWLGTPESDVSLADALADLRMRGVKEIVAAIADDLGRLRVGLQASFPRSTALGDVDQLTQESLDHAHAKDLRSLAAALRAVLDSNSADEGEQKLNLLAASAIGRRCVDAITHWKNAWPAIAPGFALSADVRRLALSDNTMGNAWRVLADLCKSHVIYQDGIAARTAVRGAIRGAAALHQTSECSSSAGTRE